MVGSRGRRQFEVANTFRDPAILTRQGHHLERWIDTLTRPSRGRFRRGECPQNLSPRIRVTLSRADPGLKSPGSSQFQGVLSHIARLTALLFKEVLDARSSDNKNPCFAGMLEPSDGLEPSTPSLPWKVQAFVGGSEDSGFPPCFS
jgi:hypothetical protein